MTLSFPLAGPKIPGIAGLNCEINESSVAAGFRAAAQMASRKREMVSSERGDEIFQPKNALDAVA
jgi:hypothetical protein